MRAACAVGGALLLFLGGCASEPPRPESVPEAIFPHPVGWELTEGHGAYAATTTGGWACANACHGEGGQGGVTAKPCFRCHLTYPHGAGWLDLHGLHYLEGREGKASCTAGCHGPDAANGARTCADCHASYPHPAGWAAPGDHGRAVRARQTAAACRGCHEETEEFCGRCHASYPHPAGWSEGKTHGREGIGGCLGCHRTTPEAAESACARCHPSWPHPAGWGFAHRAYVQNYTDLSCAAAPCHDDLERGLPTRPSCTVRCHQPAELGP
ncbi:MAG: hypothetical protein RBU45_10635 [Myxococcota bacterium]|nr:hypothetical protein [Myxococcota bacterium]